jgi:hypothetical protein
MNLVQRRTAIAFLAFAILGAPAVRADRREYRVTANGVRQAGSEVCFFRGASHADPFSLFFAHGEVKCLPADDVLDFPPGLFHAFARNLRLESVSAHRDYFIYPQSAVPERGYEELEIPLERAAIVDFAELRAALGPGQSLGVWLAPTQTTAGTYFPLVDGETTLLVPANTPLLPLLIENRMPVAVGEPMELAPGARRRAAAFRRQRQRGDVVAWISIDKANVQPPASSATAPELSIVAGGETFRPVFALPRWSLAADQTLVFFRGVPSGAARLEAGGKFWAPSRSELVIPDGGVAVETAPLMLSARGVVRIVWNGGAAAATLPDSCATSDVPRPRINARLADCPESVTADGAAPDCVTIASATALFPANGALEISSIPGRHMLTVAPPFVKRIAQPVLVEAGAETLIPLPLELFRFHGRLRLNGKPLEARLVFESGEATSDSAGAYQATLSANPHGNLVRIVACAAGKTMTYVPAAPIEENRAHDIDLELAALAVRTVDADTNKPVSGAAVRFQALREITPHGPIVHYSSPAVTSGESGRAAFDDVPAKQRVLLCAEHEAFERGCSEPVVATDVADRTVTLRMKKAARRGRIDGHEGTGMIAFVANMSVTEEAVVAPDGSFPVTKPHRYPEYAVYVGERRPLSVLPLPLGDPNPDLTLTLPRARVRTFTVTAPPELSTRALVSIWIGEHYVPVAILTYHQDMRAQDVFIKHGRPVVFRDVAETAPISIGIAREPAPAAVFIDPFALPEYAGMKRTRVASDTVEIQP